jgi:hypothetical protein
VATYVDDSAIKAEVAGIHRLGDPAKAPVHWAVVIANANTTAYKEIRRVLAAQGYSAAQIDAWDDAADWNRNIALCHALRKLGLGDGVESVSLSNICKVRDELKAVQITIDGILVYPTNKRGAFSSGDIDTTTDPVQMDDYL